LPPTSTPNAEGIIYSVVQPGDSIWSIAAKAGLTLDEILELNDLSKDDFVSVGDLLIVGHGDPAGTEPEVAEEAEEVEATETEPEPTATPEAVADTTNQEAETAAAAEEEARAAAASICLSAFRDENQNGARDEGEPLRSAVAFTISDVEKVVSNYVTDGASEPFCITGLAPGNYQITRSIASGEVVTNESAQTVSLETGQSKTLEFGSYQDGNAVASLELGSGAAASNNLAGSTVPAEDGDGGGMSGIFIAAVVIAILLLVGVLVIILTARKATV
jgi:hypothetical protein